MRLLFVLPYGPSQTRVRSRMLLETLSQRHEITLAALAWNEEDRAALAVWQARGLVVHTIPHTRAGRLGALIGDPRRPLQQIAATSPTLASTVRALIAEAARRGHHYDALHVEHLRGAAALCPTPDLGVRVVFDAVDCIAELARLTRRHNPNHLVRLLAGVEEKRTRFLEAGYVAAADAVAVVADRDRQALIAGGAPDRISVVPNGVPLREREVGLTDEPVAIFSGKLSYHANQAALRLLLAEIWPRIRSAVPDARLIVAGAEPPGWVARASGRDGVLLIPHPREMLPLIAGARVALAPTVYSVGIQNKVLEAMACGVPVVATPSAAEGLLSAAQGRLLLADDPATFAWRAVQVLSDGVLARRLGHGGQEYVRAHHSWGRAADQFEALYAGHAVVDPSADKRTVAKVA